MGVHINQNTKQETYQWRNVQLDGSHKKIIIKIHLYMKYETYQLEEINK